MSRRERRQLEAQMRRAGSATLTCFSEREFSAFEITVAMVERVMASEGLRFVEAVELLEVVMCPICTPKGEEALAN